MSTPESSSRNTRTRDRISEAIRHNSEVEDDPDCSSWLNVTVKVKCNQFDKIIDSMADASAGISCINRIMRDSPDEELPSWPEYWHCNSTKGSLHGAIEILSDVVEQQRQELLNILCEAEEVKS